MAKSKTTSAERLKANLKELVKPSKDLVASITKKLRAQKLKKSDYVPTLKTSKASQMAITATKNLAKLSKNNTSKTRSLAKTASLPKLRLK
jgi:hypothetical protein